MTPRLPDIVCVSSIDWDFIWQGHQEIMSRLAAVGHRVLFVENTGVRTPQMRDLPRVRRRIQNWWRGTNGFREERPNLFVYSPLVLPWPYLRPSRWINRLALGRAIRRWMRATGFSQPIVWTFLPTPLARDLVAAFDPQLTIYYCIDDLASSSAGAQRITASEEQLFREADLVFVTSERLRERAARFSDRVHVFPFGVSLERFEAVRRHHEAAPDDVASLARPVVGYVGGLHQWVDQDLLARVARSMPDATFALVGPEQTDVSMLRTCSNIRLLGLRPHDELPRYVKSFDVGIVPYRLTEYTANVYPTKLNEYLSMGIPVVATDLPEIRRFNTQHGAIVGIAADADGFGQAIRSALNDSAQTDVDRRIAIAAQNSWASRIAAMTALIDEALDRRTRVVGWDERLRLVYRRTRWRAAAVAIAIAALYGIVFESNAVWWLAEPLKVTAPPSKADAIVVFAGGVGESGRAGGGAQERLKQAIDLYRAGYAPYLVLSSGYVYSFHEAEAMRALAVDQGVPASAIALEEHATNTYQNVRFVDDILRDHHWQRILLVSSPYHMRRALLVWRKQAPAITVIPTPATVSQFYDHTRGATLEQVRGLAQEYVAIFAYWRRGWL
ncbi:MAG TPA: ElyC/SanA/YdcF family protein [Vicinamibacterales bacterium]|nr:ElyC/SanA/YdcF family protein [Vicinamibacterales bacterium]